MEFSIIHQIFQVLILNESQYFILLYKFIKYTMDFPDDLQHCCLIELLIAFQNMGIVLLWMI